MADHLGIPPGPGVGSRSLHRGQQSKKVWAEEEAGDQQWKRGCGGQEAKRTQWGGQQVSGDGASGEQGVVRDPGPVYDSRRDPEPAERGHEDWGVTPTHDLG